MKIVVVTQNAPLYLPHFLDKFFETLEQTNHVLTDIVVLGSTFNKTLFQEVVERYYFYGPAGFSRAIALIATHKVSSYLYRFIPSMGCHSVDNVIEKHKLHRLYVDSVNDAAFVNHIKAHNIDLLLSIASPQIFKRRLLDAPSRGSLNYHTALLPRYRGRQPLFWALFNGESEVGVTIHEMDEKLDNGPIVVQQAVLVEPNDSLHQLYKKTIEIGPELLCEAIQKIDRGDTHRIENNADLATTYSFPGREQAREFRRKGKRYF